MKVAQFLTLLDAARGVAAVYKLTPPFMGNTYVVVSGITIPIVGGTECMIFASTEDGKVEDYAEIFALRETVDHGRTLGAIGYELRTTP